MAKHIILTSNLYLPNIGGIENSLFSLASVGVENGDDVCVVSSNIVEGSDNIFPLVEKTHEGFYVFRYPVFPNVCKLFRFFGHMFSAVRLYRKTLQDNSILIARYHWSVIFGYVAGAKDIRYLVPGVVKNQNSRENSIRKQSVTIESLVQKLAIKLSSKVYVFSANMKEQVQSITPSKKVICVSPGVDLVRFGLSQKSSSYNIELLLVSRLVKAKGIDFAIEAMRFLPKNYYLKIVGDGEDRQRLFELVRRYNLEDKILFLGKISKPEHLYSVADIFLLPSTYEPFGQTLLEASACGLPSVVFKCDIVKTASKEILGDFGFYVERLDGEEFAKKIVEAELTLVKRSNYKSSLRKYIADKYSWRTLYNRLTS